jgi:VanZ family protein
LPPSTPSRPAAALFALTALLVAWFCLTPATTLVPDEGQIDKVEHFGAYLLLAGLGFAALRRRSWRLAAALLAYGVLIEGLQAWLPTGRSASLWDGVANAGGVGVAWLAWPMMERVRR